MTTLPTRDASAEALPWLGICPLLAGADTLLHGLALGAVTAVVLLGTRVVATGLRTLVPERARLAGLLLLAGGLTVLLRLLAEALMFELALAVGALFAVVVAHGAAAGVADAAAGGARPGAARRVGLAGLAALAAVGSLRELLGQGTLLAGSQALTGGADLAVRVLPAGSGLSLALLPAGAFFLLALIAAALGAARSGRRGA